MKSQRKELLNTIEQNLGWGSGVQNIALSEINFTENAMTAERSAAFEFFTSILPALRQNYPELVGDPNQTQQAENAAIQLFINEIETQLTTLVGENEAKLAVSDPNHRKTTNLEKNGTCSWNDLGRYHTALRAVLCDTNLGGYYTNQYFESQIYQFRDISYRRLLAFIIKAAFEDDIQPPNPSLKSEDLPAMSKDNLISVLAQIRREHNFDDMFESRTSETDKQSCGPGLRGRLFGQTLIFNGNYMPSQQFTSLGQIVPFIRDLIFDEFIKLTPNKMNKVLEHFESNIILAASGDIPQEVYDFISQIKKNGEELLQTHLNTLDDTHPLFYLKTLLDKAGGEKKAIINSCLSQLISIEADSLNGSAENPIDNQLLGKMIRQGIQQVFQGSLKKYKRRIDVRLNAIQHIIDKYSMRYFMFGEKLDQQLMENIQTRLQYYSNMLNVVAQNSVNAVEGHLETISLLRDNASSVDDRKKKSRELFDAVNEIIAELHGRVMSDKPDREQLKLLRPHINFGLNDTESFTTTAFYAQYAWSVVTEKTVADHFYISDHSAHESDELDYILDRVFGNAAQKIPPMEQVQQKIFLYSLNNSIKETKYGDDTQLRTRKNIPKQRLQKRNISLDDLLNIPQDNVVTLPETYYENSLIPASRWNNIIIASGQQEMLEQVAGVDDRSRLLPHYGEHMAAIAASLKLQLAPIGEEHQDEFSKQCKNIKTWEAVALQIYNSGENRDAKQSALVNFVTQTIMKNLLIIKFSREDVATIDKIVMHYMENKHDKTFFLPFQDNTNDKVTRKPEQTINDLATHLSILLTTLSQNSIRHGFQAGVVRLMPRAAANKKVQSRWESTYLLRVSNYKPENLMLALLLRDKITSQASFKQPILQFNTKIRYRYSKDGTVKNVVIGQYPGDELISAVNSAIGANNLPINPIVPNVKLESLTKDVSQVNQSVFAGYAYCNDTTPYNGEQSSADLQPMNEREAVEYEASRVETQANITKPSNEDDVAATFSNDQAGNISFWSTENPSPNNVAEGKSEIRPSFI